MSAGAGATGRSLGEAALCLPGPMTHGGFEQGVVLGSTGTTTARGGLGGGGAQPGTPAGLPGP